jgi:hypothetical protein
MEREKEKEKKMEKEKEKERHLVLCSKLRVPQPAGAAAPLADV